MGEEYTAASFSELLKNIASARKMVVGLGREINVNDIRIRTESITLADLSRHYQQRELVDRNPRIAYSTKKAYAGYLEEGCGADLTWKHPLDNSERQPGSHCGPEVGL